MPDEYPLSLLLIEIVEAVALVVLFLMVVKLWREVEVPG